MSVRLYRPGLLYGLGLLSLALSSCTLLTDDSVGDSTYPRARNFDVITIQALNQTAVLPGSYNIKGYVINFNECPPGAACLVADGITLYEENVLDPLPDAWLARGIRLDAYRPSQFKVGSRYVFSVEVKEPRQPEAAQPYARLVGYDRLR